MSTFYRPFALAAAGVLFLSAKPAVAQRQQIEAVRLNAAGDFSPLPSGYSFLHHFVYPTQGPTARFRHIVLDSTLHQRHQQDVTLGGRNVQLLDHAVNNTAAYYRFRRRQNDSLVTMVIDTAGQVLSVRRVAQRTVQPRLQLNLQLQSDSLFLVYEPSKKARHFRLHCLDLAQQERWQLTFTARKGHTTLDGFSADKSHAWFVVNDNVRSRRIESTAYCVDLKTGKILSSSLLDANGERRVAGTGLIGPDHSLLVVGRSYAHRRISRVQSGNLFATRLAPDGTRMLDHLNKLSADPGLLAARSAKTYWQTMVADPSGNVRLVGQTFTSTSLGGNIAIGVASGLLTLGAFRVSTTTLRPREVVIMQLNSKGELTQTRVAPLPERGSYTVGGYLPAQPMAELAARAGVFPVRAITPDGRAAIMRTKKHLMLLDLETQQQRVLRDSETLGSDDVWNVRPGSLMLYRVNSRSTHSLDVERVTY